MIKKILKVLLAVIAAVICAAAGIWIYLGQAVDNIKGVDDGGFLYSAEYTENPYSFLNHLPITLVRDGGCSAFNYVDDDGHAITGRNYDLAHKDEDGNVTGLNFVFTMSPEGKYSSINFADAAWLSNLGLETGLEPYNEDNDGAISALRKPLLSLLPYLTVDGMNEKGLTASILALDIKEGEEPVCQDTEGKEEAGISEMTRYIIDSCATVEEAVELCGEYNLVSIFSSDCHIFVTDRSGKGAVIEWRNNEMVVTYQDAVTNFYVSSDDACDCYKNGKLKEKYDADENMAGYRYGYGHGYARFNGIIQGLNENKEAMEILSDVRQEFAGDELTSNTQYSVVYDQEELTVKVCVMADYEKVYEYELN